MVKKKWKSSDFKEGLCFRCGEYSDKIVKKDGRCVHCYEAEELSDK